MNLKNKQASQASQVIGSILEGRFSFYTKYIWIVPPNRRGNKDSGRRPNYFISKVVANKINKKSEYTKNMGFEKEKYF